MLRTAESFKLLQSLENSRLKEISTIVPVRLTKISNYSAYNDKSVF